MNKMTGGTFGRTASRRKGEGDAMSDEQTAFEDMFPSAEVLAARLAEAYAERDALRAEVGRLRLDVGRLLVAYGSRDEFDGVDDAIKDAAEMRAENNRLRAFVRQLRADGLDIDDPTTAPVWTGKIHAPDGRLVFDLATVGEPRKP